MKFNKRTVYIATIIGGLILILVSFVLFQTKGLPEIAEQEQRAQHEGEEHDEERIVSLSEEEMKEFGIELGVAGPAKLRIHTTLSGEVIADPGRLSHIVPYVPGAARIINKKLGDRVSAGEVLAVLESRQLSELKSAFLVAKERLTLAEITYKREEGLWKKRISSEQDYLEAKQVLSEARIQLEAADQKLHAIGFSQEYLEKLAFHSGEPLTRYEIISPFDGVVINKHITMGEAIRDDSEVFTIADLSSVWVNLTVYQKDLDKIRSGLKAFIIDNKTNAEAQGTIDWVSPVLDESTRTATARIILSNSEGRWRPGMFVNARVVIDEIEASLVVPRTAILSIDGQNIVFVQKQEGFEPQQVEIGRSNQTHVEIISGLEAGLRIVATNALSLKAELGKSKFGEHGHE